jgi:tetratricopeptide (TPR) repeat protein
MSPDLSLEWLRAGLALDAAQAHELEVRLALDADDFEARAMLLGYASRRQQVEGVESDTFREHLLWCISHRPRAALHTRVRPIRSSASSTRSDVRECWQAALELFPGDIDVLTNAAFGFLHWEEFELALSTFERLERLEPRNARWPAWTARLLSLYDGGTEQAPLALAAYERAFALKQPDDANPAEDVLEAAHIALKLRRYERAQELALDLLELAGARYTDGRRGSVRHDGHQILGLIAVAQGDLATAERELLESIRTVRSPQRNTFDPGLHLANALLQRGRPEVVVEYLALCTRFSDPRPLRKWLVAIRAGERPKLDWLQRLLNLREARDTDDA